MAHLIEHAKSGRASCRKCREKIAKEELRFGYETVFQDAATFQWYHLKCAAEKVANDFSKVLSDFEEDVSDRAELEELIAANRKKQKPTTFPYAEFAPSGRSGCQVCEEKIPKGEIRIAIEREIDTGDFARMGAGYLHPQCVAEYEDVPDDLTEGLTENSVSLEPAELQVVLDQLG
jgi:hypothetical protein